MMMTFLMLPELQTSWIAVRQSNRKEIISGASLKYLDARTRFATTVGTNKLCVPGTNKLCVPTTTVGTNKQAFQR
eukprot:1763498-Pyramimonas_sp.AAC.1